ncbi:putative penicillin acylase [Actinokineospora spheciospongiae]|uniref:Putative penicillin acylase n=1 Tax=Actinokineospora spheciospongiae TaxID=909613 RepID=W7J087_9PSEU|nr:penicillin acylase family protein [Actinokineospora spheciospongiae]EWC62306.1 putative penicillin acylase [Actinokineospora spheciospongiae]PWW66872.1 F5/8 type C domain-containing protein [Actinokineospora spheciospongiae]
MGRRSRYLTGAVAAVAVTAAAVVAVQGSAAGEQAPLPPRGAGFAQGDYCLGQCGDIVPPGQNGSATVAEILANKAFGTRPKHFDDQIGKYDALAQGYGGLTTEKINAFFNDSSFGVAPDQVESTKKPRADVTIIRDKATGVPHIYGTTRSGTTFGAGYAAAQDRLFLMDVLRRVGRGQLTPFAGGAASNQSLEQGFFADAPYTEEELQRQVDEAAAASPRGQVAIADARSYLDGVNQYITEAYNGRYFPGEYVLLGHIDAITNRGKIEPFKLTDLAVIASVIGSQFGGGGGGEVQSAIAKLALQERYGVVEGERVWQTMRSEDDPEHIQTIHNGQNFPYAKRPANPQGEALPDKGSVTPQPLVFDRAGAATPATASKDVAKPTGASPTTRDGKPNLEAARGALDDGVLPGNLLSDKHGMSNALLVSGAHTKSGNPVAVFGPQTGYFAPQMLMLQELQGPGISARGASFAGISFYVLLGRGQDYSWSATSSGQDITDTYAVDLCSTDGSPVTKDSNSYMLRGVCTPMEVVERKNAWTTSIGSTTPAGSYTLRSYRTKYGPVASRATVGGKPVAYTTLRSTYQHELDTVIGFQEFNDPDAITSAADFQRAASHVTYNFNWFYADSKDIAYYNSGLQPVRQANVDPGMPVRANAGFDWVNWDPATNRADYVPAEAHPNVVNQDYLISWNNGQAPGTASSGLDRQSVHRGDLLDARVKKLISNGGQVDRVNLVQAMAEAALVDLRAEKVLPEVFRVIGDGDADTAAAVAELKQWVASGGKRTATAQGSKTYANANAIKVLDAWWPLLVKGEFQPGLGEAAYTELTRRQKVDETPSYNNSHRGSAFQGGWWGFVHKDLRAVLGDNVQAPLGKRFCGDGDLARCRQVLLDTLKQAAATPATQVYPGDGNCAAGDQWCADSIIHSALGGITQDTIGWQNRPTFQQVVEFPAHRGDQVANLSAGATATASSYERGLFNSPPRNAVDGNTGTRWASDWNDNQWLTVDLGSTRSVSRAVLKWEASYGKSYRIQVSTDGTSWRDAWSTTAGDGGTDVAAFAATDARYVRMQGVSRGTRYGYSLYEFEVYAK